MIGSGLRPLAAPDGTGPGVAEAAGLLAVADRLAVGNRAQCLPGGELELRAVGRQRHVERRPVAGEVLVELGGRLRQDGVSPGAVSSAAVADGDLLVGKWTSTRASSSATSVIVPIGLVDGRADGITWTDRVGQRSQR